MPSSEAAKGKTGPSVRPTSAGIGCDLEDGRGQLEMGRPSSPRSEGEKDSGFSDGSSEYLSHVEQTDSEEPEPFLPKAMGGLVSSLAPVYLVKNVILQPLGTSPAAPFLTWSSQHPAEKAHSSTGRILFIQQPLASLKGLLPGQKPPAREASFPGLGGSPRIAPHLGRSLQAEGRTGRGPTGTGDAAEPRRFCAGEAWPLPGSAKAAKDSWERLQPPTRPRVSALGPEALSQPATAPSAAAELAEGQTLSKASRILGRQRRFHNTVEILRRSGLLGIALRTKELLRQNSSTQRELAELREHAQLLCEAVRANDAQAWARLREAMDSSPAYWAGGGLRAQARLGQQNLGVQPTSPAPPAPRGGPPGSAVSMALRLEASLPMALP